jgi:hypothetical protein
MLLLPLPFSRLCTCTVCMRPLLWVHLVLLIITCVPKRLAPGCLLLLLLWSVPGTLSALLHLLLDCCGSGQQLLDSAGGRLVTGFGPQG